MDYRSLIRDIPDFPKEGILFKDITPLLSNRKALDSAIADMAAPYKSANVEMVIGIESRGFLFGPGVASHLDCGFAPVRKPGKLPYQTEMQSYDLEYGSDTLEIHIDAVRPGGNVLIVDDLLATGGTASAAVKLVEKVGGKVAGFSFVIELAFLNGRNHLGGAPVNALIEYS